MWNYDGDKDVDNADRLRVRYDDDGKVFIHCECGAKRYVREAPVTECSKCGAWYEFYVKQTAPPIGSE